MKDLPDMQKSKDGFYKKSISKVGVRNMKVPFIIDRKNGDYENRFHTIANISSYCNLDATTKGINMSRISRTINEVLSMNSAITGLENFVKQLRDSHGADDVYIKAEFPYIFHTNTPITNILSAEPFNVTMESKLVGEEIHNYLSIETVEMSLCPCSKEMSLLINNLTEVERTALVNATDKLTWPNSLTDKIIRSGFGAHNQKSIINIKVELADGELENRMWLEDLVQIAKNAASCPTWSTLKRPDEKYVTEVSYMGGYYDGNHKLVEVPGNGPKFVEDIARDAANSLDELLDSKIKDYVIVVRNSESIHSSDIEAVAVLRAGRELV